MNVYRLLCLQSRSRVDQWNSLWVLSRGCEIAVCVGFQTSLNQWIAPDEPVNFLNNACHCSCAKRIQLLAAGCTRGWESGACSGLNNQVTSYCFRFFDCVFIVLLLWITRVSQPGHFILLRFSWPLCKSCSPIKISEHCHWMKMNQRAWPELQITSYWHHGA